MAEYSRSSGFSFEFGGLNLRERPDSIPPNKYSSAVNVRASQQHGIQARPPYSLVFSGNNHAITDIRTYATLGDDDNPRALARDAINEIYLDNGALVATLSGSGLGVSMLPFRPSESAQAWMYVAAQNDYRKISAPDANNNVTVLKVGIAEPTSNNSAPDSSALNAAPKAPLFTAFTGLATNWVPSGNAGNLSDVSLTSGNAGAVFPDPVVGSRFTIQVSSTIPYLVGELVSMNNNSAVPIQDVIPGIGANGVTIGAIRYDAGSTGRCTFTCGPLPVGEQPVTAQLGGLRAGSLLQLASEVVRVQSVATGPTGVLSVETSTSGTHAAGDAITGIPAIVVDQAGISTSQSITSTVIDSLVTAGVGTITQTLASNPFARQYGATGVMPQVDDYLHLLVNIGDPTKITTLEIRFNLAVVGGATDYYSYIITGAQLANSFFANLTELQWTIGQMQRYGGTANLSLVNTASVQIIITATASVSLQFGSLWLGGGSSPDTGAANAPYQYRAVPRNSLTGATGNASAVMRYGVTPRRQAVLLSIPSAAYDPQIDTWDYYRYGGTILSYRYIGSAPAGTAFLDVYSDNAAGAGKLLATDNFQPWPSLDQPFIITAGGGVTITAIGTEVIVSGLSTWPATINQWLPGTLILLAGQNAYTLRERPIQLSSTSYLFILEESAGNFSPTSLTVQEPNVASVVLPYIWGPDAAGTIFGCGDRLRPGVVWWSKSFDPNATSDTYTIELSNPSEPLIGGILLRGLSMVASTDRWWALYPPTTVGGPYNQVEQSIGRGLAAPYGITSDKTKIYFWAKDCIAVTNLGPFQSLTDADLYPLFPHDGVPGVNVVRAGVTYYAPDYSRAATFRLSVVNKYLYADYQDMGGAYHTLILDLQTGGWSQDIYQNAMACHYGLEQQSGTLLTTGTLYWSMLMGSADGSIWKENPAANQTVSATLATFEWNGGDQRANSQWGDLFLDCFPIAQITAQPMSNGASYRSATLVPADTSRSRAPVSVGGEALAGFLGIRLTWTDVGTQSSPTIVYLWQPSFVAQPEIITDRIGDWVDFGGIAYVRGLRLNADTFNTLKLLSIRAADDGSLHQFVGGPASGQIQHNGEQEKSYAFITPFVAHLVRYEPQDSVPWRYFGLAWDKDPWPGLTMERSPWLKVLPGGEAAFLQGLVIPLETNGQLPQLELLTDTGLTIPLTSPVTPQALVKTSVPLSLDTPVVCHSVQIVPLAPMRQWFTEVQWVAEPTPEIAYTWKSQMSAHGLRGFMSVPRIEAAWASAAPVTLTFSVVDGTAPAAIVLPATSGVYQRKMLTLTPNKGQAYAFNAVSAGAFQIFQPDWVIWMAPWGRSDSVIASSIIGGATGDRAVI